MLKPRIFDDAANYSIEEKEQMLTDTCDGVKSEFSFTKQLTKDELDQRRERKVNLDIEIAKRSEEMKSYVADCKKGMEPLLEESGILLATVRNRFEQSKETVYFFKDEESGMIGFYDVRGDLVFSRRMTPEEKQKTIYSDMKVGPSSDPIA